MIENGELMTGIICKKTVGAAGNGLNHIIMVEEGPEIAKEFYGDLQKVVNNWLLVEGHSIGRYLVRKICSKLRPRKFIYLEIRARYLTITSKMIQGFHWVLEM